MGELNDVDRHFLAKYGDRYVGERKALRVTLGILGNVVPVPLECVGGLTEDQSAKIWERARERSLPAWIDPKLYTDAVKHIGENTKLRGDALHKEAMAAVMAWQTRTE